MREWKRLWVVVPAVALLGLVIAWAMTRGAMEQLAFLRRNASGEQNLVDQRAAQTAMTLAPLAVSAEEQGFAQQAVRLADHEVDQAFAQALRMASLQKRALTGEALASDAKVTALKATVAQDKASVDALTAAAAKAGTEASAGDDLDIAKAQLGLDQDELTDATGDLARESGDVRPKIQQELQAREAMLHRAGAASTGETAVTAARRYGTLWGRGKAWFEQRSRVKLIAQAEGSARDEARGFAAQHDKLEGASVAAGGAMAGSAGMSRVKALEKMGSQRAVMSILDDRVQTEGELAAVYGRWQAQVWVQHRIVGHLLLESLAWIALVVLLAAVGTLTGRLVLGRMSKDVRRTRTLETIFTLGVQVVAVLVVGLVVFGAPEQMPTILGLATAGLTVVFQDFILAFFGWFVLMGRNGIRVGDWVEIDGVGGEVSEIGLFRTVLLETGNWTSRGHPTGRRVTFTNSFAIRGQYFNFSTHGQWMWDEIKVTSATVTNAYGMFEQMRTAVVEAAASDCDEAEQELRRASGECGVSQFSAAPTVDMRPLGAGVEVVVRFVTRANERFERRSRLNETIMRIMEDGEKKAAPAAVLLSGG